MHFTLQPWQFYLVILAGWVNHQQQQVIDYLRTENQVLKEKLGPKRILLNDDQRRRMAVQGKILGRKMLEEVGTRPLVGSQSFGKRSRIMVSVQGMTTSLAAQALQSPCSVGRRLGGGRFSAHD